MVAKDLDAKVYDVIVVGLGAVGSAALYALARQGARVLGIDRFRPPHDRGSSHGESRIMRQAIGEGEAYVPLVLRSNAIWEELEHASGQALVERCGFVFITRDDLGTRHHGKSGFLARTRAAAQRFVVPHEVLDAHELAVRFPQFIGLHGDEIAYYEPGGGYLRPENCIRAALAEAQRLGARVITDTKVGAIDVVGRDATARFGEGGAVARHVIVATGSWVGQLGSAAFRRNVAVHRQVLHWFQVLDPTAYPEKSPTFIWTHGLSDAEQFYGFPPIGGEVKVAREDYAGGFDPDVAVREIPAEEGEAMARQHVGGRLAALAQLPARSSLCHYAVTPDADFLLDTVGPVTVVSACSGHGFKHAAAIGEALGALALGMMPAVDLSVFSPSRRRD